LHLAFYFAVRIYWQTLLIYLALLAFGQLFSSRSLPAAPPRFQSSGALPSPAGSRATIRPNPAAPA
jgi:hypothetical protein